jgi:hypothetical protein
MLYCRISASIPLGTNWPIEPVTHSGCAVIAASITANWSVSLHALSKNLLLIRGDWKAESRSGQAVAST